MGELINGRTAEEIKLHLTNCAHNCTGNCSLFLIDNCVSVMSADALALIERLEAAQPRWISVKERLPPPETKIYLIASHSPDGEQIIKTSIWDWDEIGETGDWINWNVVTHWMPLPEPPKEG